MRSRWLCALGAALVWAAVAGETPIAEKVSVPNGTAKPAVEEVRFTAPAAKEGERLCLAFDAHFEMPVHGGWSQKGCRLSLNGKPLGKFTASGRRRVLERAPMVRAKNRKGGVQEFDLWQEGYLFMLYGPSSGEIDPRIQTDREQGHAYLLDVSDVAKEGENTLAVENHVLKKHLGKYEAIPLVLSKVRLVSRPVEVQGDSEALNSEEGLALVIKTGDRPTTRSVRFTAPAVKEGERLCLSFDACFKMPVHGGWNQKGFQLRLNGRRLGEKTAGGSARLLNRGGVLKTAEKGVAKDYPMWREDYLLVFYGKGEGELNPRVQSDREAGYHYVLDISDVVKAGENTLELTSFFLKKYLSAGQVIDLSVWNLRLERQAAKPVDEGAAVLSEEGFSFRIPTGDKPGSRAVRFPAVAQKPGQKACLAFRMYIFTEKPGGWNPYCAIDANGTSLRAHLADGKLRLLKRGEYMATALPSEPKRDWWKGNQLMTFFGPGRGEMDRRLVAPRECGYDYLLDVSDCIHMIEPGADGRIESAKENVFVFSNLLLRNQLGSMANQGADMVFEGLRVVYLPEAEVERARPALKPVAFTLSAPAATLESEAARVTVTHTGGLVIEMRGERYYMETALSYPAKPEMRFNLLGVGRGTADEAGWRPGVRQLDAATAEVAAAGKGCRVTQRLTLKGDTLSLRLEVANTSGADLGCQVVQRLAAPGVLKPGRCFLSGFSDQDRVYALGNNPTVMVSQEKGAVALLAEDDATRNHVFAERRNNLVEMTEPHLGIPKGASHTLEYTLFLLPTTPYIDFVNRVRRHWDMNCQMVGPWGFARPHWTTKKPMMPRGLKCHCVTIGHWFEYEWNPGEELTREQYKAYVDQHAPELRAKNPGMLLMASLECNLVTMDKQKHIPGWEALPKSCAWGKPRHGVYGNVLTKEQTKLITDLKIPYADSMLYTKDGRLIIDNYYPYEPLINFMVQIEEGNGRFKHAMEQFIWLLDTVGLDGIYFDQFAPGCGGQLSRKDRCSYNRWDGRTVVLAADGTISEKVYDYAVTGTSGRVALARAVTSRGKLMVANTHPISKAMLLPGVMRFDEMENDDLTATLLGTGKPPALRQELWGQMSSTPIALGIRPSRYTRDKSQWARLTQRAIIIGLRHGVLYYPYHYDLGTVPGGWGVLDCMFPSTPVELGEGFLIAKERILTAVTRSFTTASKPKAVRAFTPVGLERPANAEIVQTAEGWKTTVKLLDWQETAAIILE